ncbi:MAG: hypothetical protein ACREMB_16195 [Candidatus Rokuibacteriota bacterium]
MRHSDHLSVARSMIHQTSASIYPLAKQRADQARRGITRGLAQARQLAEPVRDRLNAPLIRPPRFGTVKQYRMWRETRAARPQAWNVVHWPLGVWLVIGIALIFSVKSLLL